PGIEAKPADRLEVLLERTLGILCIAQVLDRDPYPAGLVNPLHPPTVNPVERGAKDLVARYEGRERTLQGLDVEGAAAAMERLAGVRQALVGEFRDQERLGLAGRARRQLLVYPRAKLRKLHGLLHVLGLEREQRGSRGIEDGSDRQLEPEPVA